MNDDHWKQYNGGLKPTIDLSDAMFAAKKGMGALRAKGLFLSGKATHEYKRIIAGKNSK
jgi:hypothetical protein